MRCRRRQIQADASVVHSNITFGMPQNTSLVVWLSISGQTLSLSFAALSLLCGTL
jgi:hypothetical protein